MSDSWLPPPKAKNADGTRRKRKIPPPIIPTPFGLSKMKALEGLSKTELIEEILRLQKAIRQMAIEIGEEPNDSGSVGFDSNHDAKLHIQIRQLKGLNP